MPAEVGLTRRNGTTAPPGFIFRPDPVRPATFTTAPPRPIVYSKPAPHATPIPQIPRQNNYRQSSPTTSFNFNVSGSWCGDSFLDNIESLNLRKFSGNEPMKQGYCNYILDGIFPNDNIKENDLAFKLRHPNWIFNDMHILCIHLPNDQQIHNKNDPWPQAWAGHQYVHQKILFNSRNYCNIKNPWFPTRNYEDFVSGEIYQMYYSKIIFQLANNAFVNMELAAMKQVKCELLRRYVVQSRDIDVGAKSVILQHLAEIMNL